MRPVVCIHGVSGGRDASGFSNEMRDEVARICAYHGHEAPEWHEAVYSDLLDLRGSAVVDILTDATRYEHDNETRLRIFERVRETLRQAPGAVVVAHSLGSVVAYDTLAVTPIADVHALVTLGSPLGISLKGHEFLWRAKMARDWWPSTVQWWDFWSELDPIHTGQIAGKQIVRGAQGLASVGYPCQSRHVDTGCDPLTAHTGYWSSIRIARCVVALATE